MRSFSEKVMADARKNPCIRCGATEGVYGRHYNGLRQHRFGKGRGIKCHGVCIADFCAECDKAFHEGSTCKDDLTARTNYSEEFMFWCLMSQIRRVDNGVIV